MYQYSALTGAHDIRLIRLHGASDKAAPVTCSIIISTIGAASGSYDAISYAWEGQKPSRTIFCDGLGLEVTRNCEAILRYFRPESDRGSRMLWIDAICIDQSEAAVKERNQQVANMGTIYQVASSVCVWLGDSPELNERYGAAMKWIYEVTVAESTESIEQRDIIWQHLSRQIPNYDLSPGIPWFSRLWVLQEISMARKVDIFFCSMQIPYSYVKLGIQRKSVHWSAQHWLARQFQVQYDACQFLTNSKDNSCKVARFLGSTRTKDAMNPKDKIFGIFALLQVRGVKLPLVDYSKPVNQIYCEATRGAMESDGNYNMLMLLDGFSCIPGLPSWVPDLTRTGYPPLNAFDRFQPHTPHASNFSFSSDGLSLSLPAFILETITCRSKANMLMVSERFGPSTSYKAWTKNPLPTAKRWLDILSKLEDEYMFEHAIYLYNIISAQELLQFALRDGLRTSDEQQHALRMLHECMLIPGLPVTDGVEVDDWDRLYQSLTRSIGKAGSLVNNRATKSWLHRLGVSRVLGQEQDQTQLRTSTNTLRRNGVKSRLDQIKLDIPKNVLQQLRPEMGALEAIGVDETLSQAFEVFCARMSYQTFFKTSSGKLVSAPLATCPGDQVVRLPGCSALMVIRRDGEHHRLIAPACIPDIHSGNFPWSLEGYQTFTFK